MDELLEDEDEEEKEEWTRETAKALFDRMYDELEYLKTEYPKDYKFCFNSRREIDEIIYSYLSSETQKCLQH